MVKSEVCSSAQIATLCLTKSDVSKDLSFFAQLCAYSAKVLHSEMQISDCTTGVRCRAVVGPGGVRFDEYAMAVWWVLRPYCSKADVDIS